MKTSIEESLGNICNCKYFDSRTIHSHQFLCNSQFRGYNMAACNNLQDLHWLLKGAIANAKNFFKLNFDCAGCGEPMWIDDELIEAARKYLEKHWRHNNC